MQRRLVATSAMVAVTAAMLAAPHTHIHRHDVRSLRHAHMSPHGDHGHPDDSGDDRASRGSDVLTTGTFAFQTVTAVAAVPAEPVSQSLGVVENAPVALLAASHSPPVHGPPLLSRRIPRAPPASSLLL